MKRNSLIIFLLVALLILGSCHKNNVEIFHQDNIDIYINSLYQTINDENIKYACFDLRDKTSYETEHIRQFDNHSLDDLVDYLIDNYQSKYYIYLYSEQEIEEEVIERLSKYKQLFILNANYNDLKNQGNEYFIFDSGPYNCMC